MIYFKTWWNRKCPITFLTLINCVFSLVLIKCCPTSHKGLEFRFIGSPQPAFRVGILCRWYISFLESVLVAVFLTHVSICANADAIANIKSKIIVLCWHFFINVIFFLPFQKFKTKIKLEKNPYTQANTCLLHILRNFKDIFKYKCFTLYL